MATRNLLRAKCTWLWSRRTELPRRLRPGGGLDGLALARARAIVVQRKKTVRDFQETVLMRGGRVRPNIPAGIVENNSMTFSDSREGRLARERMSVAKRCFRKRRAVVVPRRKNFDAFVGRALRNPHHLLSRLLVLNLLGGNGSDRFSIFHCDALLRPRNVGTNVL